MGDQSSNVMRLYDTTSDDDTTLCVKINEKCSDIYFYSFFFNFWNSRSSNLHQQGNQNNKNEFEFSYTKFILFSLCEYMGHTNTGFRKRIAYKGVVLYANMTKIQTYVKYIR